MGLLLTFLLGLFILVGVAIVHICHGRHHTIENFSIALACGTMTALVFADLLPEAIEHLEEGPTAIVIIVCIAAGVGVLKILDHFIPDHDGERSLNHECTEGNVTHIGIITTVAVTLHNLIEGMAVYSVAAESFETGLLMALGVGLHNIPMGIIIASTLEHERLSRRIGFLATASLSTFAGGLVMFLAWGAISDFAIGILISLTLGMIVYIVAFELVPHMIHTRKWGLSALGVVLGVAIVLVSLLFD